MAKTSKQASDEIVKWAERQEVPELSVLMAGVDEPDLTYKQRLVLALKLFPPAVFWSLKRKAEYLGVSDKHIFKTERLPIYQEICKRYAKEYIPNRACADIISTMTQKAIHGDVPAARFLFEYTGKMISEGGTTVNTIIIENIRKEKLKTGLKRFGVEILENVITDN